jgi:O-antigen ligase
MVANGHAIFANSNSYKTFLLSISVLIFYILVEWWLNPVLRRDKIELNLPSWKLITLLSLPILGTLPGLLITGGSLNLNIKHEIAIHIGYMLWLSYLFWSLKDNEELNRFLYIVGAVMIYLVLVGLLGVDIGGVDSQLLAEATFGNKNLYSNFLILWAPLLLLMALPVRLGGNKGVELGEWSRENSYFMVVLLFVVVGLVQAQTRSAIVGVSGALLLLAAYLLFLLLKRRYMLRGSYYLALISVLVVLVPVVFYLVVSQLDEQTVRSSRFLSLATWHGWSARFMSWQTAWNSIMEAPWFGWGAGSSYNLFFQYVPADSRLFESNRSYAHVHNEWLEILQEGGVFGLLLSLFPIFIWLYYIRNHLNNKVVLGVSLGIVAYLFHGTFSLATRMTVNEVSFYTLIATLLVQLRGSRGKGENDIEASKMTADFGRWIRGGAVVVMIVLVIPSLQGSYDLRQLRIEEIGTKEKSADQIDRYYSSESVEALHWLAVQQIKRGDIRRLDEVLGNIDSKINNYRDVHMLRAVDYQLNAGVDLDIGKFKRLIMRQWELDRYSPPVLHWLARISAWEKNESEVLQHMRELFQYEVIYNRILPKSKVDKVLVKIHNELDGFALVVSKDGAVLLVGRSVMDSVMEDLRQINSQEESNIVNKRYIKKVYLKMTEDGFTEVEIVKIKGLLEKVLSRLASWSQVPDR